TAGTLHSRARWSAACSHALCACGAAPFDGAQRRPAASGSRGRPDRHCPKPLDEVKPAAASLWEHRGGLLETDFQTGRPGFGAVEDTRLLLIPRGPLGRRVRESAPILLKRRAEPHSGQLVLVAQGIGRTKGVPKIGGFESGRRSAHALFITMLG